MKNFGRLMALAVLLCGAIVGSQAIAQVEVSVDRSEVARGETLVFTIRVHDQRQGMQLDLTPLTSSFDVLGTRTSSQIRSFNGSVESWTDYIVTLFPLEEGELEIPSLNINNTATDAIVINVVNEGPRSNQASDELFLEIEVNKESVYVQEQLLFTVRLYYTINGIRNPQFTELEMPDTVIQLIGSPNQYEKLIDGVRYGVYEKRYVIFPQRSGPLEIPDILFRGEVTDGSSNFVFRNLNTRRVTAFIDGITIDVKERPAVVRGSDIWLPVAGLSMEESWNIELDDLQVGDSLVRTITMVADGLDGAVLPPFSGAEVDGLNFYPDPPVIQRTFVDGSIVGTRIETTTIVPTASGIIEIPQISIPWWNINTDQLEATVVPATRLSIATIEGVVPAEQTVASTADLEELLAAVPVVDQDMIDAQAAAEFIEVDANWLNYAMIFAFVVVGFSVYSLVLAKHKEEIADYLRTRAADLVDRFRPENNERVAYKQLRSSCSGRDLIKIRANLILWCNHFFSDKTIVTMEDILQQRKNPELHRFAQQIQSELFNVSSASEGKTAFNGKELIKLTNGLRRRKSRASKQQQRLDRYALPPLYRT